MPTPPPYRNGAAAARSSIVLAVFNQLDYTRRCIDSLAPDLDAGAELVAIDNGSTDGAAEYLAGLPRAKLIRNDRNLGCAPAWNQGVRAATRDWIVVLNNDTLVTRGWLDALIGFGEREGLAIATPAIREGPLNYPLEDYAAAYVAKMRRVRRLGVANGICFAVRKEVFQSVGLFDEKFRIGVYEDADFFLRARLAGLNLGTTGAAFIHHFGSLTQKALGGKQKNAPAAYEEENRAYYRRKWNLTPTRRFWQRQGRSALLLWRRSCERLLHGHSLQEKWIDGKLRLY